MQSQIQNKTILANTRHSLLLPSSVSRCPSLLLTPSPPHPSFLLPTFPISLPFHPSSHLIPSPPSNPFLSHLLHFSLPFLLPHFNFTLCFFSLLSFHLHPFPFHPSSSHSTLHLHLRPQLTLATVIACQGEPGNVCLMMGTRGPLTWGRQGRTR